MTKPEGSLHPHPAVPPAWPRRPPDPVAVGTIIWLASELMFFAALFAAYFTIRERDQHPGRRRGHGVAVAVPGRLINIPFAIVNTSVLVRQLVHLPDGCLRRRAGAGQADRLDCSTCGAGVCASGTSLTFLMGAFFIGGQVYEYAALFCEGLTISSNRLRLGLLPGHRLPRPACHRRSVRLPAADRTNIPGPDLHPRASRQRDRRVLLLALRRRRLDRSVRRHLHFAIDGRNHRSRASVRAPDN